MGYFSGLHAEMDECDCNNAFVAGARWMLMEALAICDSTTPSKIPEGDEEQG